jgi:glycosyltransferase involved in cell wall biosynthesis
VSPLVSFLTPAYNAAGYLGETIRSVLAQTYPRVEMIVVNDGSSDDTSAVARAFGDPRVKVIDQENRGQSASENVALAASQGDYVVHLDADDLISPNKVEVQVRRLLDAEPGCVAFHPWGRFYADPRDTKVVPEPFWRDIGPLDFHVEMWERHSMVQGGCYLIPRALTEAAGPWDESLSLINDFDFFPRVLFGAGRLLFCPEATLHYRSGLPNALSGSKTAAAWDSAFRALESGTAVLLRRDRSDRARRACSRAYEEFVFSAYPAVPDLRRRARDRVRDLGGPYFRPQMGPKMRAVSKVLGWRLAKQLSLWVQGRRRSRAAS